MKLSTTVYVRGVNGPIYKGYGIRHFLEWYSILDAIHVYFTCLNHKPGVYRDPFTKPGLTIVTELSK